MPKPKRSGYMLFAIEWKNEHARGMSSAEAAKAVSSLWDALSKDQRNSYKIRAKQKNGKLLTETEIGKREMQCEIEKIVKQSVQNHKLKEQTYIFVMAQYFAKIMVDRKVVPAEIALCKFSIKEGVYAKYHTFVNYREHIFGHQLEADQHSKNTHKLPIPPKAMGNKDLGRIYNEILDFARTCETGEYSPIFTLDAEMEVVKGCINYLRNSNEARNEALKIFSLNHLFYILKTETAIAGDVEKPQNHFYTDAILDQDKYEHESNIGCKFHEENDNSKYCAQSCVTRWGYDFSDCMCEDVAVHKRPGSHTPIKANSSVMHNPSYFERPFSK